MTEGCDFRFTEKSEAKTHKKPKRNKNNPPTYLFNKILSEYSYWLLGSEEDMKDCVWASYKSLIDKHKSTWQML